MYVCTCAYNCVAVRRSNLATDIFSKSPPLDKVPSRDSYPNKAMSSWIISTIRTILDDLGPYQDGRLIPVELVKSFSSSRVGVLRVVGLSTSQWAD